MKTLLAVFMAFVMVGCSTNHYVASKNNRSGKIMAKGYTHDGCVSNLKDRASELEVEVRLERVSSSLVRYRCYGSVVEEE